VTYCYLCPTCGEKYEKPYRSTTFVCYVHVGCGRLVRDYRAEAVNVGPVR
jgi:hypothetical protein